MKTIGDMSKYYTPGIEEFFPGFEYEYKYLPKDEKFYKAEFEEGSICKMSKDSEYRVKYLDREDIESLGFAQLDRVNSARFLKGNISVWLGGTKKGMLSKIEVVDDSKGLKTSFLGKIKNKSELKKLLKQLGI